MSAGIDRMTLLSVVRTIDKDGGVGRRGTLRLGKIKLGNVKLMITRRKTGQVRCPRKVSNEAPMSPVSRRDVTHEASGNHLVDHAGTSLMLARAPPAQLSLPLAFSTLLIGRLQ